MRKIKVYTILIIVFLVSLVSTNVFAVSYWENENKKRKQLFEDTLANYLEQYMKEDTPEEKRIVSHEMSGYGISKETDDILAVHISFIVEPYVKENTIWSNSRNMINNGSYSCYAKYKKVNGDYELERVSEEPENYDKFLEEFEKYKANLPTETSTQTVQGKQVSNNLANQEISKMSNEIFIGCGIVLTLIVTVTIITTIRRKKQK